LEVQLIGATHAEAITSTRKTTVSAIEYPAQVDQCREILYDACSWSESTLPRRAALFKKGCLRVGDVVLTTCRSTAGQLADDQLVIAPLTSIRW